MMSDPSAGMPLAVRAGAASALCGPFTSAAMADECPDREPSFPVLQRGHDSRYGFNRPGAIVSAGIRENVWPQGMIGGIKAQYDCIKALVEGEF
jgi:hypothetical protein